MEVRYRPAALIILDGWGHNPVKKDNAIFEARTPFLDGLMEKYPHALLSTSGEAVGLPEGQMGTSEVGHLNIGAGRIVYQSLVRITKSLKTGEIKQNPVFTEVLDYVEEQNKPLHFMGLLSPGGVHSHTDHLYEFLRIAKEAGIKEVFIHAVLDGRDTPPTSAEGYIQDLQDQLAEIGLGKLATVMGRYYAMDRDHRWERTEKAYAAMVYGEGITAVDPKKAVQESYKQGINDEFIIPIVLQENGEPVAKVRPKDAMIFFNFRPDRARQITRAFVDEEFSGFQRRGGALGVKFACLTQYDETIKAPVIFPPEEKMRNILGSYLSEIGLSQLRIAETEKYAHVTFFFNGGEEVPFPGEERVLIPSPKVATYDLKPEMSAYEVTDRVLQEIAEDKFDVIIMNYANCDMVGHTGIKEAAIRAVEAVDKCLSRVIPAILEKGGAALVTADHGNAEMMVDPETGEPYTAHTTFQVPVLLIGYDQGSSLSDGKLADLAPTLLEMLGLPKPVEMTGECLIRDASGEADPAFCK